MQLCHFPINTWSLIFFSLKLDWLYDFLGRGKWQCNFNICIAFQVFTGIMNLLDFSCHRKSCCEEAQTGLCGDITETDPKTVWRYNYMNARLAPATLIPWCSSSSHQPITIAWDPRNIGLSPLCISDPQQPREIMKLLLF